MAAGRGRGEAHGMLTRSLALAAALFALCAADAAARVAVGVSNRVLVVSGTILRDQINITQAGITLRVSDKDDVDVGAGCGSSAHDAVCALSGIDRISINT